MLPWRWHRRRVRLGAALAWCVGGFCLAILLAAVLPMALGLRTYTVRSGSMTPAIRTGDAVVSEQIPPTEAEVGDIVTFRDPAGTRALITHRARAIEPTPEGVRFVTRGDANNTFERWIIPADGSVGRVVYRIPLLGYPLARIGSRSGRAALVVLPALILCLLGLLRIWLPDRVGAPLRPGSA